MDHDEGDRAAHGVVAATAQPHHQRPQAHQSRPGEHELQIRLAQRPEARHDHRRSPGQRQRPDPDIRAAQHRRHARDEVDPGLHHCRGMQVGRYRRGGRHRAGQPEMERELRRFREAARKHKHHHHEIERIGGKAAHRRHLRQAEGACDRTHNDQPRQKRQPADARDEQGLLRLVPRIALVMVIAHQQEGRDRRAFPRHEQRDRVIRQHQPQHRGREQRHQRQQPRQPNILAEIFRRIEKADRADPGDHQREEQRQRINAERRLDPQRRNPLHHEIGRTALGRHGQECGEPRESRRHERRRHKPPRSGCMGVGLGHNRPREMADVRYGRVTYRRRGTRSQ